MAVESLSNIKAETGRDLTGLTNDNTLLFAETSNGTDGVATVAELTKGCMKETNGTVTGDHNFTGTVKVKGNEVVTYEIINGNNCKVIKHIVGSLCTLDIYIDATSNISAWESLCSVPEPKSSNVGFLVNNSTSYRLYVSKSHKVLQNADTVIPSGVYTGSVTYEMA